MTNAATIDWRGDDVISIVESRLATQLDSAANHLRDHIVNQIGEPRASGNGQHSRAGEYPHSNAGRLRDRVFSDRIDPLTRRVFTDLNYGLWLELGTRQMRPRPFLTRALREETTRITTILSTGATRP